MTYRNKRIEIAVYWAMMTRGYFACWKQQARKYKHGFVLRILWFGLAVRYGQDNTPKSPWYTRRPSAIKSELQSVMLQEPWPRQAEDRDTGKLTDEQYAYYMARIARDQ